MTISAKSIIQRAVETANDKTSIYWSVAELVRYLNDGMREIATLRPDAFSTTGSVTCVAGSHQTIPADGMKLLDIPRNGTAAAPGKVIYKCDKKDLDNINRSWHTMTSVAEFIHFSPDLADPKRFWLYPPAIVSTLLEVVYCAIPTDVNEAPSTPYVTFDDLPTTALPIQTAHANVLCDYILFRQYSKDTQDAGNMARAGNHLTLFGNSLGIDQKTNLALATITRTPRAA